MKNQVVGKAIGSNGIKNEWGCHLCCQENSEYEKKTICTSDKDAVTFSGTQKQTHTHTHDPVANVQAILLKKFQYAEHNGFFTRELQKNHFEKMERLLYLTIAHSEMSTFDSMSEDVEKSPFVSLQ